MVEALALETRGSKASVAATEEIAAGKKAAEAEVFAARNKPEAAEEANKSAGAAKKEKKKMLVKVSDDRINFLLANPLNLTLSYRLRSFTQESAPFAYSNPERRRAILDQLPGVADSIDQWNEPRLDILRQYHETGCAYEEIEVGDEDN